MKIAVWNETRSKLIKAGVDMSSETEIDSLMDSAMSAYCGGNSLARMGQSWDLVNSLYYCSSLYTTVGKVAFSMASKVSILDKFSITYA